MSAFEKFQIVISLLLTMSEIKILLY